MDANNNFRYSDTGPSHQNDQLQDEEPGELHHGLQQGGVIQGEELGELKPDDNSDADEGGQEVSGDVHAVHA